MKKTGLCILLTGLLLAAAACSDDSEAAGTPTIQTVVEGSSSLPDVSIVASESEISDDAGEAPTYTVGTIGADGQTSAPVQTAPVQETTTQETAPTETQPAETTAAQIMGLYSDPNNGNLVDSQAFTNVSQLSNNSIPYGCDWDDRDAKGLPNGVYWYESKYSTYNPVYYINTDQPVIYITMDEGYEAGYTPAILDTLKEKGVHAVFFITRQFFDSSQDLIQRMINEGHIIGNHTCKHPSGGYPNYVAQNGIQSFIDDVTTLHKLVYDTFGYTMKLFRFPEGEASEMLMAELYNLGYTPIFWTYAHLDYDTGNQPDPAVTLERCVNHMGSGSIYLLHAVSSSNTAALGAFIDQARAAGYTFGEFPVDAVLPR